MNGFLCKIKNWMLIHSATLEIRSVLGVVAIWVLLQEFEWGKFRELLPILTSRALSYITRGGTYIRTVLLYASECWASNVNNLLKLQRNDRAMIRWTCNVRLKDHISSDSLLRKLGINNIQTLLRYNRLRWFGQRNDGCINSITEFEVVGQRGRGRPKKTWKDTINKKIHSQANLTSKPYFLFIILFSTHT